MSTKPGDETKKGLPDLSKKPTNPELKVPGRGDKYTEQSDDNRALGENLGGVTGTHKVITGETAPEVSQGAWRERAFMPRATMGTGEMLGALRSALENAKTNPVPIGTVFTHLRADWLPVLRQAMEQAGGDGLDAWLLSALKPPGKGVAKSMLLQELIDGFAKMRTAIALDQLLSHASSVVQAVEKAAAEPKKVSFKQMERELEGKIEIHELLLILFCDDSELQNRLTEITGTMETIRGQLKSMPGAKPDGMYSNFARLKAEARVLTAELARRAQRSKVIPP